MSEQSSNRAAVLKAMEDVANAVAAINGIKAGLVNEGWDPINAESAVVAMFQHGARS